MAFYAARGRPTFPFMANLRLAAGWRRGALAIGLTSLVTGCISAKPDPRHLAQIDRLGAERLNVPLKTQELLQVDPRVPAAAPTGVLTLQQATDLALKHNLALVAGATNIPIAQAQLAQAALMQNPTLGQTGAFYIPVNPVQGGVAFDILLTQPINTFITQGSRVDAAKAQRFQAGIDLASQAFDMAEQVAAKYQEIRHVLQSRQIAEQTAELFDRSTHAAAAQAKVGFVPMSQVNRARLQADDARRQVRHLATQYQRAAQEMNWLMGFATAPAWRMPDDAAHPPGDLPPLPGEAALVDLGGRYRLDLLRADFDRKLATVNLKLAKLNLIPATSLGADYAYNGNHAHSAGPQLGSMALPIFDQGTVALQAAKYQVEKADKTYVALAGQVRQDVRTASQNLKMADEDVRFYRDHFIPQQMQNVQIAEKAFKVSTGDLETWLSALRDYATAQQSYVDALQARHDGAIALQRAVGLVQQRLEETSRTAATQPAPPHPPSAAPQPPAGMMGADGDEVTRLANEAAAQAAAAARLSAQSAAAAQAAAQAAQAATAAASRKVQSLKEQK